MQDSTFVAMERLRAQKKNPVVLWILNFLWPGLGNLCVGQVGLGILFGLLEWGCILITILTFGLGAITCVINWVLASAIGHSRINNDFARSLGALQSPMPATPLAR